MCMSNEILTSVSPPHQRSSQIADNAVGDTSECLLVLSSVPDSKIWSTGLIPERIQQHDFATRKQIQANLTFSLFEQVLQHEAGKRVPARLGNVHGQYPPLVTSVCTASISLYSIALYIRRLFDRKALMSAQSDGCCTPILTG